MHGSTIERSEMSTRVLFRKANLAKTNLIHLKKKQVCLTVRLAMLQNLECSSLKYKNSLKQVSTCHLQKYLLLFFSFPVLSFFLSSFLRSLPLSFLLPSSLFSFLSSMLLQVSTLQQSPREELNESLQYVCKATPQSSPYVQAAEENTFLLG